MRLTESVEKIESMLGTCERDKNTLPLKLPWHINSNNGASSSPKLIQVKVKFVNLKTRETNWEKKVTEKNNTFSSILVRFLRYKLNIIDLIKVDFKFWVKRWNDGLSKHGCCYRFAWLRHWTHSHGHLFFHREKMRLGCKRLGNGGTITRMAEVCKSEVVSMNFFCVKTTANETSYHTLQSTASEICL